MSDRTQSAQEKDGSWQEAGGQSIVVLLRTAQQPLSLQLGVTRTPFRDTELLRKEKIGTHSHPA